jgi:hypothetical protein
MNFIGGRAASLDSLDHLWIYGRPSSTDLGWPPQRMPPMIMPPKCPQSEQYVVLSRIYLLIVNTLSDPETEQATLNSYRKLLEFLPGLKEQTAWTRKNHPSGISDIAALVCA